MYDTGALRAAGDWLESVAVPFPGCTPASVLGVDPDGSLVRALIEDARVVAAAEARTLTVTAELARRSEKWEWDATPPRRRDQDLGPHVLAAAEIGPALRLTPRSAMNRVDLAVQVVEDLPLTLQALADGVIDMVRLRVIADAVFGLGHELASKVEQKVLRRAGAQTPGELRAAVARAVITADPQAAEKRREAAVASRSVSQYVRPDGTGVLGSHLSAADSLAMYDLIDEVARRTAAPDDTRSADARRADAHVWLLLGRDPLLGPTGTIDEPTPPPPSAQPEPYDDTPDPGTAPETDDGAPERDHASEPSAEPGPDVVPLPDDASASDDGEVEPDSGARTDARAEADTGGAVESSRDFAAEPYQDDEGFPPEPGDLDERFPPEPDPVADLVERCLAMARARLAGRLRWVHLHEGEQGLPAAGVTTIATDAPFAYLEGYGPITIEAGRDLIDTGHARPPPTIPVSLFRVSWGGVLRHDPPAAMDREIRARDGTCRFPGCRARARRGDLDHTERFPEGLTVHGNLAALCRRHHRVKHRGGWTVHQRAHGLLHWTSPTGMAYTTYPRGLDASGAGTANGHVDVRGHPRPGSTDHLDTATTANSLGPSTPAPELLPWSSRQLDVG